MREWWARMRAVLGRRRLAQDLRAELDAHLQMEVEARIERGMTPRQALDTARREFGSPARIQEASYDVWLLWWDDLGQDVRYGVRALRRSPAFASVAVLVLAIGTGASTAMFSVVHGVLLQPVDYPDPDTVVSVARGHAGGDEARWLSLRRLNAMRDVVQSFTGIGAFAIGGDRVTLSGTASEPEVLRGARVSANFLEILQIQPRLGRGFLPDEDVPGGPAVAMISAGLWQRRFASAQTIVGTTIMLEATPHTVVGVLPDSFRFPEAGIDVWRPQPARSATIESRFHACCVPLMGFARLKPGVTREAADAELAVLNDGYLAGTPGARNLEGGLLRVTRWQDELTAGIATMLWMLFAAVALVLLIGCANVATLVTARATARARELAVRASIGATRGRLVRQLLTESVLLASAGALLGLAIARLTIEGVRQMTLVELPRAGEIRGGERRGQRPGRVGRPDDGGRSLRIRGPAARGHAPARLLLRCGVAPDTGGRLRTPGVLHHPAIPGNRRAPGVWRSATRHPWHGHDAGSAADAARRGRRVDGRRRVQPAAWKPAVSRSSASWAMCARAVRLATRDRSSTFRPRCTRRRQRSWPFAVKQDVIFAGTATLFVLVACLASLIPAWRAARIDPAEALRT